MCCQLEQASSTGLQHATTSSLTVLMFINGNLRYFFKNSGERNNENKLLLKCKKKLTEFHICTNVRKTNNYKCIKLFSWMKNGFAHFFFAAFHAVT